MNVRFEVGAKTARLMGRENIADVDGALIELIKNAYDADAECVYVLFDMPFPYVPSEVAPDVFTNILSEADLTIIQNYYIMNEHGKLQRKDMSVETKTVIERLLFSYNKIIIADNGCGMSKTDVMTKWMYIGTNDKEINATSDKGRIKTGAKGIGRFALDKLSLKSKMYTKKKDNALVEWAINWEQFADLKLLKDISAEIEETDEEYSQCVRRELGVYFDHVSSLFRWDVGTLIILTPICEEWSERLFQKVNLNLKSINPLGSSDIFRVFITNEYFKKYNFVTEEISISETDYDYKISIDFDGEKKLTTRLLRNEIEVKKKKIFLSDYDREVNLDSFWSRPYFTQKNYLRNDYRREIEFISDVTTLLDDDANKIREVGQFKAVFYFLKINKSTYEITKSFIQKDRKELINKFAGIKLYRDMFKVRPYGDSGTYFDWLDLGRRQQDSPGGVGSESGSWRVLPYQLMGQVNISRFTNAQLIDMSNREGLAQNDTYLIFVNIIQEAIRIFEIDRQGFYREYTNWINETIKGFGNKELIKAEAKKNFNKSTNTLKQEENQNDSNDNKNNSCNNDEPLSETIGVDNVKQFSDAEYQETVYDLLKEIQGKVNSEQMMQLLSSSGLILNTFFHEFKAFSTHFGSRAAQLRVRVDKLLQGEPYTGSLAYNPYVIIDKMQETDDMLSFWLKIAMDGIEKDSLNVEKISLTQAIDSLINKWDKLLESKDINISFNYEKEIDYLYNIAIADIYIIINNFLLNSVWFLECEKNKQREIIITLDEMDNNYLLHLENNGPTLNEKYRALPNKIFEIGESSKGNKKGTGVGLWIVRETVERYGGSVIVSEVLEGFGIDIYLKK